MKMQLHFVYAAAIMFLKCNYLVCVPCMSIYALQPAKMSAQSSALFFQCKAHISLKNKVVILTVRDVYREA